MSKLTINMHTSQRTIAKLNEARWARPGGDEQVVTGYAPAEIYVIPLTDADVPLGHYEWYAIDPGNMFNTETNAVVDAFVTVNERGFIIDKDAVEALHGTTAQAIVKAVGCKYASSGANPATATQADEGIEFQQPVDVPGEEVEDHGHESVEQV